MALNFDDLEKLPDDVKYELPDGTTVTLGEIRAAAKSHVDTTINKRIADLTPREQKLSTRERELETRAQQLEVESARVRETMAALANTPPKPPVDPNAPPPPLGYTPEQWAAILNDPYSRPLVTTLAALADKTEKLEKALQEQNLTTKQREDLLRQQREADWINYQFEKMGDAYKDPANRKALLDFAQEVLTRRDITILDRARNYDTHIKAADEAGYQRGLKEGKVTAPVPSIPHGTRQVPTPPTPEKLPATFNEFADNAANDPAFLQEIREAASAPSPAPNQ